MEARQQRALHDDVGLNMTGRIVSYAMRLSFYEATYVDVVGVSDRCRHDVHSTCSGDSEMGVMGLEVRRCFLPLLRLRSLLGFFCAYSGGRTGNAWAMGG